MKNNNINKILIVDLESTCSDDDSIKRHETEIIEIGAAFAVLENEKWIIKSEFSSFVKPVKNPILTDFCKKLTTITQSDIEKAETFSVVYPLFEQWILSFYNDDVSFGSWGNYDFRKLYTSCLNDNLNFLLNHNQFINIKELHAKKQNLKNNRGVGLKKALYMHRNGVKGVSHRAIWDVRNITEILDYCL